MVELDVRVGGRAAERGPASPTTLNFLPLSLTVSPILMSFGGVGVVEYGLAGAARAQRAPVGDLAGPDRGERGLGLVDAGDAERLDVERRPLRLRLVPAAEPGCGRWKPFSGTVPLMLTALSVKLPAASCTPSSAASLATCDAGKLSCAADMKSVRVNFSPGFACELRSKRVWPVLLLELAALLLGQPARPLTLAVNLQRAGNRHVGANSRERLQHLVLRFVEAGGERADRDDQADPDAEAEGSEQRAALTAAEFGNMYQR